MLGTIQVQIDHSDLWSNKIRALCDSGAQVNLITINAVKKLNLSIEKSQTLIMGVDHSSHKMHGSVVIPLILPGGGERHYEKFYVVSKITGLLPAQSFSIANYPEFHNLYLADPNYATPAEIDALIGVGLWIRIVKRGLIKSKDLKFAAQRTILGWILYRCADESYSHSPKGAMHIRSQNNGELDNSLQRFRQVEEVPVAIMLTQSERECERIFDTTHTRMNNGRYVVQIPFNDKIHHIGQSKSIAMRQFFAMERRMDRDAGFKAKYHEFFQEFLTLGHMDEINESRESGYYHSLVTKSYFVDPFLSA